MVAKERVGYIYLLRNLVNGKGYVGQTVIDPEKKRWPEHIYAAFVTRSKQPLYKAIRKYGVENFSAEVVHRCAESNLNAAEMRFIAELRTFIDDGQGYNLTTGGGACKVSRRTRSRMSEGVRMAYANDPTFRARLSAAQLSNWKDNEARRKNISEKLRAAHRADPSKRADIGLRMRGIKKPESVIPVLSATAKAQWNSDVGRQKKIEGLRRGAKARWDNETEHTKASENRKALWADPTYRAKMIEAQRRRRERERLAKIGKVA